MAFRFRICQNTTVDVLKELFNATPLRVPEASVQPQLVIAEKHGKTEKRGEIRHLLNNDSPLPLDLLEEPVANVALEKTRSMDVDFALKVLDGFFKGFNLPTASISTQVKKAKEISLTFHNVKRRRIDKNQLGTVLRDRKLDLNHPSAGIFLGDDCHRLLLVTDTIVSNGFSINATRSTENGFDVEVPTLQKIVDEAQAEVKVRHANSDVISFEGNEFLTFAFTSVQLDVNPLNGNLTVGTTVITRESKHGTETIETVQAVELDDDFFEPGMLEWD